MRLAAPDVDVGSDAQALAEDLMELCDAQLPGYAVPHQIRVLTSLPTSANGKLDKAALQRVVKEQGDGAQGIVTNTDPRKAYHSMHEPGRGVDWSLDGGRV